ncbi:hypothetical protein ACLB9X_08255 [Streptomyces sp. 5K101]|uniref:hypothetical protein n=1 Tax=Streptomyces sp. 5K101 TaxID=3390037 RepID=UPI0039763520
MDYVDNPAFTATRDVDDGMLHHEHLTFLSDALSASAHCLGVPRRGEGSGWRARNRPAPW